MLLSRSDLAKVDAEITNLFSGLAAYIEGDGGSPSLFEQAFICGKVASEIGAEKLKTMSGEQVSALAKRLGVVQTEEDRAVLANLKDATAQWTASLQDEMNKRVREVIANAEADYANQVMSRSSSGELRKAANDSLWEKLKETALATLTSSLGKVFSLFIGSVDRFVQTELAKYFQFGQTQAVADTDEVYKLPRPTACPHCMRLHLRPDGTPIIYRLKDVRGNTNVGKKSAQWEFVVGPVHPHCYCILYKVSQRPPTVSQELADARKKSTEITLARRKELLAEAKKRYEEAVSQMSSS